MAGVPSVQRARGVALILALLLAALPGRASATDGSIVLADESLASMVADLDGDAEREVIAIRRHPDDGNDLVVEAWTVGDGTWPSLGSSRIERWDAEEARPQPARFGREGIGMLALRNGPRTRAIVATVTSGGELPGGCCLSLSVLAIGEAGISVELVDGTFGPAESLQVVDLEDDGVDEVVVSHTVSVDGQGASTSAYLLLRQLGDGFELETLALPDAEAMYLAATGESDGVSGHDLLFVDYEGSALVRIVAADGDLQVERATADALGIGRGRGWVAGAASGVIAMVGETGFATVHWPRGGRPEQTATLATDTPPYVILLGEGPGARWLDLTGIDPSNSGGMSMKIYDLDLRLEREIEEPALTRQLWDMTTSGSVLPTEAPRHLWEHAGPIPYGLGPDRPAFLGHGSLVEIEPDGSLDVRPAAHLVGVGVLGAAGTDGAWLAVAGEWGGFGTYSYLGNTGYEPVYSIVAVIPFEDVVDEGEMGRPAVEFRGATVQGTGAGERLFTTDDAFQVTVSGGPGDIVIALAERRSTVGEISGTASVTLTVDPPGRPNANREFELSVFVVGPTGLTTGVSWQAVAIRVPPEVTATADVEPFSLRATVSGQISGEGSLIVDGREVVPSPSGRFRMEVDAPAWPREVLVVARDPLGNETTQRLEVIGFVDYRGLPWIPIVGTLTVVAGLVLFVRTPHLRPEERLRPDGDGRLEEIDGDLV